MICKKCVLPEHKPDIWLDDDGVCNVCRAYERETKKTPAPVLETDLIKILNQHKSTGKYDCLVMCSGGKDSTSALYYMKQRYHLNPLAFMFDHGFETEGAVENVQNAVDILGIDFLFYKSNYVHDLFAKVLHSGSPAVICHLCSLWYMQLTFDTAARYDIPLIVAGWTKGQSVKQSAAAKCAAAAPEYVSMAKATSEFIDTQLHALPKYRGFPKSMEEVIARAGKKHKCLVISPHWFLPYDQETYVATIARELRWKAPPLSYPRNSTNCELNFLAVHNSMKHFGYTHYHIEASKLIREGLLSREQALKDLEISFDKDLLNRIAGKLGYSFPEG